MLIAGTGGQIIGPYLYVVGREVVKLAGRVPGEVQLQKQLLSAEHDRPRRRRICDWWPSWSSLSPPAPLSRTSPCASCCSIFLPKLSGLRCPWCPRQPACTCIIIVRWQDTEQPARHSYHGRHGLEGFHFITAWQSLPAATIHWKIAVNWESMTISMRWWAWWHCWLRGWLVPNNETTMVDI